MAEDSPLSRIRRLLRPQLNALVAGKEMPAAPHGAMPFIAHEYAVSSSARRTLWIVHDDNTALEWLKALTSLRTIDTRRYEIGALVSWGVIPYSFAAADKEKEYQRTRAEYLLRADGPCTIIASVEGAAQFIATDNTGAAGITLKTANRVSRTDLIAFLGSSGYQNTVPVTRPGEFCLKGSVLDVFPPDLDYPVRLDFFGDDVESIKAFSHETQRSVHALNEVRLLPLRVETTGLTEAVAKFLKKTNMPRMICRRFLPAPAPTWRDTPTSIRS